MPIFDTRVTDPRGVTLSASGVDGRSVVLGTLSVADDVGEPVREARRFVRRTLGGYVVAPSVVDDAVLIVSELVTNVVRHGVRAGGLLAFVRLVAVETRLWIEVHDSIPHVPVQRPPSEDAEHGRGLVVVDALADRWGVERMPAGKCVWCELAI